MTDSKKRKSNHEETEGGKLQPFARVKLTRK